MHMLLPSAHVHAGDPSSFCPHARVFYHGRYYVNIALSPFLGIAIDRYGKVGLFYYFIILPYFCVCANYC